MSQEREMKKKIIIKNRSLKMYGNSIFDISNIVKKILMRRFQLHCERIPNEIVIKPEQTSKQIMIIIGGFSFFLNYWILNFISWQFRGCLRM